MSTFGEHVTFADLFKMNSFASNIFLEARLCLQKTNIPGMLGHAQFEGIFFLLIFVEFSRVAPQAKPI